MFTLCLGRQYPYLFIWRASFPALIAIGIGENLALFFIQNNGCFVLVIKGSAFHKSGGVLVWG